MAYPNNFYNQNPYGYNMYQPQMVQPQMQIQQPINNYRQLNNIQGKSVDNIEVVKATEIPLDGSISYFPLTDGTAIVTKQLQMDGTSKTIIYKPVTENENIDIPKYVTDEEFKKALEKYDTKSLKDDIKNIKRELKDLAQDIKDMEEK